jgi:hypothetical protein
VAGPTPGPSSAPACIAHDPRVHLVDAREILHVHQENRRLHHVAPTGTGLRQNGAEVPEDLLRLRDDVARDDLGAGRVKGDLAGGKEKAVRNGALGVGSNGSRGLIGVQRLESQRVLLCVTGRMKAESAILLSACSYCSAS